MSGTIHVLHVDDDPDFLDLAAAFLPRHSSRIQVLTSQSVDEAMEYLPNIDCIISDYEMPEASGLEFLDTVRNREPSLPFILCTGRGSEEIASEAISRNVTDYIQKGGLETFELLANRIEKAVSEHQAVEFQAVTKQEPFAILERITDAFMALDNQFRFTYLNETAAAEFGTSADQLLGTVIWEQFPEAIDTVFYERYQTAIQSQEPQTYEEYFEPWNKWYREYVYPSEDGLSVFFRDVTEIKEREQWLDTLTANSVDAVIILDRDGAIRFLSQPIVEIIGYRPDELTGNQAFGLIHPDDVDRVKGEFNRVVHQPSYTPTIEFRLAHADGDWIHVEVTGRNLLDDSLVNGIIVNLREITERRASEKQLATLHETTRALIRANEPNRVVQIATEAARDIVGLSVCGIYRYRPESDTLSPGWLTPESYDLFDTIPTFNRGEGLVWQAYENGEKYVFEDVSKEDDRYNPDTKMRSELIIPLGDHGVLIAGDTVPDAFDDRTVNLAQILAANVEVALDRIDHHRTLIEREQELLRQNEQLEEFTSVVSHDLRNPLTVAMGRLDLLKEECESDQLPLIESSLNRMEELVEDLLSYALIDDGIRTDDVVNLAERIESSWNNVRTFNAQIEVDADVTIRANSLRLAQLFENLIRNSIEHGGEHVNIRVGILDNGFFFEDDGSGIPETDRENIFKAGFSTSATGTGFGLSIVRNVALNHDWEITVGESDSGGARFEFTGVDLTD